MEGHVKVLCVARIWKHLSACNARIKIAISQFSSVQPPRTKEAIFSE